MLNTMWPGEGVVKVECPGSPVQLVNTEEFHRLTPPDSRAFFYPGDTEEDCSNGTLVTLATLPPSPSLSTLRRIPCREISGRVKTASAAFTIQGPLLQLRCGADHHGLQESQCENLLGRGEGTVRPGLRTMRHALPAPRQPTRLYTPPS